MRLPAWLWRFSRPTRMFVSYPKSGRTWIRYVLVQLGLDSQIQFDHDGFPFTDPKQPAHDFGIPPRQAKYAHVDRLVYLERDPRDVMVSMYFQITGRFQDIFGYQGNISEFIRDDFFGADNLHRFRTMWSELADQYGFLKVSYEDCHRDMRGVMRRILDYYGFQVDPARLTEAVAGAEFNRMKKLEQSGQFPKPWLRPRNDSPKVRQGRIGGHQDVLGEEDVRYLNRIFHM